MLERYEQNGLILYRSPLLQAIGVPHAFSTRSGGVSSPPFASLNLGTVGGSAIQDPNDNLRENYRRLHTAIGCDQREHCGVRQVHGSTVRIARRGEPFENGVAADALVSNDPARTVGIKYADCVPILLASEDAAAVAAVHAGWRGILAGVLPAAVAQLAKLATGSSRLLAAIGPCVSTDAFEVGPEVVAGFVEHFGADAPVHQTNGKPHIDLRQAVLLQLQASSISRESIDLTDLCTFASGDEFFSHRRDGMLTGRMAAVIGCKDRS
jgi:YfiH family protein